MLRWLHKQGNVEVPVLIGHLGQAHDSDLPRNILKIAIPAQDLHDVVGLTVNGASVDEVLRSFPNLTRAQVYECLAYYEDHRAAIDVLVAEQMTEGLE